MKHRLATLVTTASLVGSMWVAPALAEEMSVEASPTNTAPKQTQQVETQSTSALQSQSSELGEESLGTVDAKAPAVSASESQVSVEEFAGDQVALRAQSESSAEAVVEAQATAQLH